MHTRFDKCLAVLVKLVGKNKPYKSTTTYTSTRCLPVLVKSAGKGDTENPKCHTNPDPNLNWELIKRKMTKKGININLQCPLTAWILLFESQKKSVPPDWKKMPVAASVHRPVYPWGRPKP